MTEKEVKIIKYSANNKINQGYIKTQKVNDDWNRGKIHHI